MKLYPILMISNSFKYLLYMLRKILLLSLITLFQIGCSERYVYQAPAPVFRSKTPTASETIEKTVKTYKYPEESATQNLPKLETIKPMESLPAIEPIPSPIENTEITVPTSSDPSETSTNTPVAALPPVAPALPPISTASFSPATLALATEADQNIQSGQYDAAAVKLERALRIDPRNAALTYKLAAIRLKQEQPRLAEDLAKKAALLAGTDRDIKKRSWLLIAESKRLQKDLEGAAIAEQKAAQF